MSVSNSIRTWCSLALSALAVGAASGCLDAEPEGELGAPTLATVQSLIFTPKCSFADCHGGATPRQGMSLEPGKAFPSTVNVQAVEAPLLRINPGNPDKSYLVAKIEGRHREVGGSGERMPLGFASLSNAEIKLVRDWVTGMGKALAAPPKVSKVTPPAAAIGDSVVIEGEGFGDDPAEGKVLFGETEATFVGNWSATKFEAIVPQGLATGTLSIVVSVNGKDSEGFSFDVIAEKLPSVISVTPDMGPVGASIAIKGSNFGDSQGSSTVSFGGTDATTIKAWSNTDITVEVPTGAASGDLVVNVGGKGSNATPFFFLEPKLSSLQAGLFNRRCALADCHGSADPPPQACAPKPGLSLLDGQTHANLVGVDSCGVPGLMRVTAGNKAQSFLFDKLSSASPQSGDQMPADGTAPLPPEVIQVVGAWIDQGANND
ncbi:MAG: IPT/TIG domain-containing protein [Polyangiaceae bacterium]